MKFKLEITCDNAAFDDDPGMEVASILAQLVDDLRDGEAGHDALRDVNGNTVGTWMFTK